MQTFKVSKFITLKLEDGKSVIYINGKRFRQCKHLIVNIPISEIKRFDEIQSIDELINAEENQEDWEETESNISKENEFWAHSSNLQAWYENNYDTRLLHSNLAFPLLKELTNAGDPLAKRAFKEEIVKRLGSGYPPIVEYLNENKYDNYLTREELIFGILITGEAEIIYELERIIKKDFYVAHKFYVDLDLCFIPIKKHVTGLAMSFFKLYSFPCKVTELTSLKELLLGGNNFKSIPKSIERLKDLKSLYLFDNKIDKLPESIGNLMSLEILNLCGNALKTVPNTISKLTLLKELDLSENPITDLPESILKLNNLKRLKIHGLPLSPQSKILVKELITNGVTIS